MFFFEPGEFEIELVFCHGIDIARKEETLHEFDKSN
jgi:hypothetical protein